MPHKGLLFPTGYLNMRVSNNAVSVPWMVPQVHHTRPTSLVFVSKAETPDTFHTHLFLPSLCALGAAAVDFDDLTDSVESLGAVALAVLLLAPVHCALSDRKL